MENRILCLLLLSVAFTVRPGDAQDPFTERPEETVVFVNDSAQLNCSFVTLPSFVVWQKGSEGIAVNRDVNNDLEDSYEVTGDDSLNQFHLRVIEAAVDLSGTYTCSDFSDSSIRASADLIVIDGAPECSIYPGYTVVENEEITLVCMSSSVVDLAWLKDGVEVQG
ncbi:kin of IRRE-like protein 2 [Ptychodera flava]|uniref:kin of IRRE-like protein 2 n=1 Tax=Ptychodera flava TaxID=63121 RepID=UPI00396A0F74